MTWVWVCMQALQTNQEKYPNPDRLPIDLILELGQICVEENACEFMDKFSCM